MIPLGAIGCEAAITARASASENGFLWAPVVMPVAFVFAFCCFGAELPRAAKTPAPAPTATTTENKATISRTEKCREDTGQPPRFGSIRTPPFFVPRDSTLLLCPTASFQRLCKSRLTATLARGETLNLEESEECRDAAFDYGFRVLRRAGFEFRLFTLRGADWQWGQK